MPDLIVEDGTGSNPNANSYQTVNDLRTYAAERGVDVTGKLNDELEVLMIKAMDYLESKRDRYQGYTTSLDQPLQWPRFDVWDVEREGQMLPSDEIPRLVRYAQLSLALEALNEDLQPNPEKQGPVIKEKAGDVEITYSSEIKQNFTSAFAKPHALLAPLFKRSGLRVIK